MNYEQDVTEFLVRPENLPIALEVARRVELVKDHLRIEFWHAYRDEMQKRLQTAECAEKWKIELTPEKDLLGAYADCRIEYCAGDSLASYLNVNLQAGQLRNDCNLFYGLSWSQHSAGMTDHAAVVELRSILEGMEFKLSPWAMFLMYINIDDGLRRDDFLIRFASMPQQVVEEKCDIVWAFFEKVRQAVESCNKATVATSV